MEPCESQPSGAHETEVPLPLLRRLTEAGKAWWGGPIKYICFFFYQSHRLSLFMDTFGSLGCFFLALLLDFCHSPFCSKNFGIFLA